MLRRLRALFVMFAAVGVVTLMVPANRYADKSEEWLEAAIPDPPVLGEYSVIDSSLRNPTAKTSESYQMQIDILRPFGIVTRTYMGPDNRVYELTVIAGNTRKSFHDPKVCFSAQSWALEEPRTRTLDIPSMGGAVQATVMGIKRPEIRGVAAYFYKGPFGLRPGPAYIPFDLTFAKLMMKDSIDALFFRFIVTPATRPRDESREAAEAALQEDMRAIGVFAETAFGAIAENPDNASYFLARR